MRYTITPQDTLFFGQGKPSNRGEDTYNVGVFPPLLSVFLGAFRSCYFSHHPDALQNANTERDPTADYCITEYSISLDDTTKASVLFPAPADMMMEELSDGWIILRRMELQSNEGLCSVQTPKVLRLNEVYHQSGKKLRPPENIMIDEGMLQQYLSGGNQPIDGIDITRYITAEPKVGIFRDRASNTAMDGRLYRLTLLRAGNRNARIRFDVSLKCTENAPLPTNGLIKLGAFGKCAAYQADEVPIGNRDSHTLSKFFCMYLATPAIFKANGWYPSWIQGENDAWEGYTPTGLRVRLLAAAVSGYESCGGYDMKKRMPRVVLEEYTISEKGGNEATEIACWITNMLYPKKDDRFSQYRRERLVEN